tara:strand:+ start:9002 stop:9175 length:174 start_codon:yes stop_codon:yes gene_type:complete
MSEEFLKDIRQAYRNMIGWNDCHPCGGDETSRELERSLGKFLRENKIKKPTDKVDAT